MLRSINVRTDTSADTSLLLPGLQTQTTSNPSWQAQIFAALLRIGAITAPPRYRAFHLASLWAWLRYASAISRKPRLRLRRIWDELDSHQKTILSDDFGMGFPALYLQEHFAFEEFADTNYVLERQLKGVVTTASMAKRGPSKTPDFIATDSLGRLHILECKGTQIRRHIEKQIARGIEQKSNLSNGTIFTSAMVGALYIPQYQARDEAELIFADPDINEDLRRLSQLSVQQVAREIRRQALAKCLSAAGLWNTATALSRGTIRPDRHPLLEPSGAASETLSAGFARQGDEWTKLITSTALEPRYDSDSTSADTDLDLVTTSLEVSIPNALLTTIAGTFSSNSGLLNEEVVDDYLDSQRILRMPTLQTIVLKESDETDGREIQTTRSSWQPFESSDENSASLLTSAGIRFRLSRTIRGA